MSAQALELFKFTAPESLTAGGYVKTEKQYDSGGMSVSIRLAKRKDVAKSLGLAVKSDKATEALLKLSDGLKAASLTEVAKLCASPDWTGGNVRVSRSKNGAERRGFTFVSVERKSITPEQVASALASMSDKDRQALIARAADIAANKTAIAVGSQVTPQQAPAQQPARR